MKQLIKAAFVLHFGLILASHAQGQYTFEMMNGRMLEVYSFNDTSFIDIKYTFDKRSLQNERIRQYNDNLHVNLANKFEGSITRTALDSLVEEKMKPLKEPKVKEGFTAKAEVFAIHHPDGNRELLYEYNEAIGNDFTVDEMQHYIWGQRDALLNFKAKRAFWGGVAFGAAGAFAWQNSVFTVTTPAIWLGITAIPTIHIRERYMSDPSVKNSPYKDMYRSGFARTARTRNMIQGLKGSVIGTVAGALIFAVVANNAPGIRY